MVSRRAVLSLAAVALAEGSVQQCPGALEVAGVGEVHLVAAEWNTPKKPAGPVEKIAGTVLPEMWGRAYFADACTPGAYNHTQYTSLKLLGKRLSYNTDLSQLGCGCNGAFYLVAMQQNSNRSGCSDYYCDAANVCGVRCAEIDIQEANMYAWHSTLHRKDDGSGLAAGYGGWVSNNDTFSWSSVEYGPGAKCIDTSLPFRVSTSFPVRSDGLLRAVEVALRQGGCEVSLQLKDYAKDPGLVHLTKALASGMTPVLSYWKSSSMLWLDGPGNGGGPCKKDAEQCGSAPQFDGFAVEDI